MATIWKRRERLPVPEGAEITTNRAGKQFAVWTDRRGRRQRAPLTEDGEHVIVESGGYTVQYFDAQGRRRKKTVKGDLDTARAVARQLESHTTLRREGIIDARQERMARQARRPLAEHLADFEGFLHDKGNTPKHIAQVIASCRRIIDILEAETLADLTALAVMRAIGELRAAGLSTRTTNSYLASIKSLTRWAWKNKRIADDPLCGLSKANERADRRCVRRPLGDEELRRLIDAAEAGPVVEGMSGPERAMLYLVAAATGFRRKELASLTPRSLDLDAEVPTITIEAAYSKNGRQDTLPLHPVVAERLRQWLAGAEIAPTDPLFALRQPGGGYRRTSKMLQVDLQAARQQWLSEARTEQERAEREQSGFLLYQDPEAGTVADFHAAGRHTFITNLGRAGVPLTTAQKLARHSTPTLTANVYTHLGLADRAAAIGALPLPVEQRLAEADKARLRATGTEG